MKRLRRFWLPILLVLLLVAGVAWTQRGWLTARGYVFILELDWRVRRLQVDRVTDVLGVIPGQKVADIGAGSGLFSRKLANAVGSDGVVYAVDLSQKLLDYIEESAEAAGINNIKTVLASEDDPSLPEPVDLIFICNTLHHIENQEEYLRNLKRYLRPSGRVAIIDFIDSPHIFSSDQYTRRDLERWLTDAGFQPAGRYTFLQNNYFVIYMCKTCPEV